jgi:hypothetical protein
LVDYLQVVRTNVAQQGVARDFPGLTGSTPLKLWLKWLGVHHEKLSYHLWLGLQVLKHVSERGVESSVTKDDSWRRVMKKAIIDRIDMKVKELDSKTAAKMTELDSKAGANFEKTNELIEQLNAKVEALMRRLEPQLQPMDEQQPSTSSTC